MVDRDKATELKMPSIGFGLAADTARLWSALDVHCKKDRNSQRDVPKFSQLLFCQHLCHAQLILVAPCLSIAAQPPKSFHNAQTRKRTRQHQSEKLDLIPLIQFKLEWYRFSIRYSLSTRERASSILLETVSLS